MKISYLGPAGTFTQQAIEKLLLNPPSWLTKVMEREQESNHSQSVELVPEKSQKKVIAQVAQGHTSFGCVPVESSIAGSVTPTLDGLVEFPGVRIIAEVTLPIRFVLAATEKISPAQVQSIALYPIAEQQVSGWLDQHMSGVKVVTSSSNAAAAVDVVTGAAHAAITTEVAAHHHNLHIIEDSIIDEVNAHTRFVMLCSPQYIAPSTGHDRTGMAFDLDNVPGSLAVTITELSVRGIDLIRLESRPKKDEESNNKYWFFADINGHISNPRVAEALIAIKKRVPVLHYFGSWEMDRVTGQPPVGVHEQQQWMDSLHHQVVAQ